MPVGGPCFLKNENKKTCFIKHYIFKKWQNEIAP